MIRIAVSSIAFALTALPAAGTPAPKPTKEDLIRMELARLEGTWKVVSCRIDGKEAPAARVAGMATVTFKGADYTFASGAKGKIAAIDPTTSPKTVEYQNEGSGDALAQSGIYRLEGDTFEDCVAFGDKPRPKEFISKEGSGYVHMKYVRVKDAKK